MCFAVHLNVLCCAKALTSLCSILCSRITLFYLRCFDLTSERGFQGYPSCLLSPSYPSYSLSPDILHVHYLQISLMSVSFRYSSYSLPPDILNIRHFQISFIFFTSRYPSSSLPPDILHVRYLQVR